MNSNAENPRPCKGKVLIVDDEPTIRQRLKELCEKLGFEVQTAGDGFEGLECFSEFQPDLVVLDIYMPGMNGLIVLSKIRKISPSCRVVLITGFLHYEQLIKIGGESRPDGCIVKPMNNEQTANLILKLTQKQDLNNAVVAE
jgi:YesN/AraC family two-component response regulator